MGLKLNRRHATIPIRQLSLKGSNVDELAAALSSLCLRTEAVLESREAVSYNIHSITAGPISLIAGVYEGDLTVRHRSPTETDVIILPLSGRSVVTMNGQEMLSEGTRGVFVNSLAASATRFIGSRRHLGLRIPRDELIRRLALRLNMSIRGHLDFAPDIDLSTASGSLLVRLSALMYTGLADGSLVQSPIALSNLTETTIELLMEAARHRYSSDLLYRTAEPPLPRSVKRAIDYMRAHISEPITVNDIAAASGVSPRTLQQGFRDFRDTTPFAFLQRLRLEAAHRELMTGGSDLSVKQVALKWGFVHRGRFSADYRKRYGVLPSETLRSSGSSSAD